MSEADAADPLTRQQYRNQRLAANIAAGTDPLTLADVVKAAQERGVAGLDLPGQRGVQLADEVVRYQAIVARAREQVALWQRELDGMERTDDSVDRHKHLRTRIRTVCEVFGIDDPAELGRPDLSRRPLSTLPAYGDPETVGEGWDDDAGRPVSEGVGWDLTFGCTTTIGHDHPAEGLPGRWSASVSLFDRDGAAPTTAHVSRDVTPAQIRAYAHQLLALVGDPAPAPAAPVEPAGPRLVLAAEAAFWMGQAAFWMGRAMDLQRRLEVVAIDVADTLRAGTATAPPEPPVGTSYRRGTETWWQRRDDGWHCATPDCGSCPAPWPDVWELLVTDQRNGAGIVRRLAG